MAGFAGMGVQLSFSSALAVLALSAPTPAATTASAAAPAIDRFRIDHFHTAIAALP
jgi:hypothetical protein